jgi:uncharacterized protein YciW
MWDVIFRHLPTDRQNRNRSVLSAVGWTTGDFIPMSLQLSLQL